LKSKNILVITYWSFDNALIQTYTLPYVKQIKQQLNNGKIYLFCLSQNSQKSAALLQQVDRLKKEGIFLLEFNYVGFGLLMGLKLLYIITYLILFCWIKRINYIHAWCTPGGAIAYPVSIASGKPLILDSFEPHAETMVEGNTWKRSSLAYQLLFKFELLQLKRAKEVICAAPGMENHSKLVYGISKNRYFVKPACVDLELFNVENKSEKLASTLNLKTNVCVYAGKFGGIYLEQEVFDFFKVAFDFWKGDFSVLLLTAQSDEEIKNYCHLSGFPYDSIIKKLVPHTEVPKYMALGTFGFCPVKPLPSKEFCTPIKNGEYWAMGLPVIITKNISGDSALISNNNIGYVIEELTEENYHKAIAKIEALKSETNLSKKIRLIAIKERNFANAELIYKTIYA
jgi:glycosyltransferase involved in cell wall biosynthesis